MENRNGLKSLSNNFSKLLACPDDGSGLSIKGGHLECIKCGRKYNIIADKFLEILPSEFPKWMLLENEPKGAEENYQKEYLTPFSWDRKTGGWGDLTNASPGIRAFYNNEGQRVSDLLVPQPDAIGIDVSGAVGNHAIVLSNVVETMINCDLHVPSIITAYQRMKKNMICIRSPYLKLPLISNGFDFVICTDTLIRGWNHEVMLLKEILRILKIGGKAFVDFHNLKWFKRNYNICEYKTGQVKRLLKEANITKYSIEPFGYVPIKLVQSEFV
ncbi:MAG: methyltransferase domain-containing protein [Nitrospinae bacterium]|nr:methyltransferase domain-containing protein [Nitrospinota bacterium]